MAHPLHHYHDDFDEIPGEKIHYIEELQEISMIISSSVELERDLRDVIEWPLAFYKMMALEEYHVPPQ